MGDPSTCTATTRHRAPPSQRRSEVPPWVLVMINIAYKDCTIHSNGKENKSDRFCIDCLRSFCNKCSSSKHHGHNYIKIRRYVYCEVISRPDFQKHFDCSGIQVSAMAPELATVENNVSINEGEGDPTLIPSKSLKVWVHTVGAKSLLESHTIPKSFLSQRFGEADFAGSQREMVFFPLVIL
ncbi:hypothetical protein L6452_13241 [Arctium lappa]|uniref:Uncharacterized protein n=1 Tax=Arctium lappa TaxID=4217 RepID=A0ACB9CHR6_ARCLA|nr:hypothetical protein L6452_13241 [Arctium lappa]